MLREISTWVAQNPYRFFSSLTPVNKIVGIAIFAISVFIACYYATRSKKSFTPKAKKIVVLLDSKNDSEVIKLFEDLKRIKEMPCIKMLKLSEVSKNPELLKGHHIVCHPLILQARCGDDLLYGKKLQRMFGKNRTILIFFDHFNSKTRNIVKDYFSQDAKGKKQYLYLEYRFSMQGKNLAWHDCSDAAVKIRSIIKNM